MAGTNNLELVIGGAASGKSAFAERLVRSRQGARLYLATAQAFDDEMRRKIEQHQRLRAGDGWETVEEPLNLLPPLHGDGAAILLDCATVWLGNQMIAKNNLDEEIDSLIDALIASPRAITIVTNEVGQGIVPADPQTRRFRDAHGRMNQKLAAISELVVQVTAGLPVVLKGQLPDGVA